MPTPSHQRRKRAPKPERRRALELLASARHGLTESLLFAQRRHRAANVELVRDGLANASSERVAMGAREIEVARVRINDEGWRVLAEKPLGKE
jgi:hypothetical protein